MTHCANCLTPFYVPPANVRSFHPRSEWDPGLCLRCSVAKYQAALAATGKSLELPSFAETLARMWAEAS